MQAIQVVSDDRTIDLNHAAQPHGFDSALVKHHGGIFDHFRRTDVHGRVLQGRADQLLVHHAVDRKVSWAVVLWTIAVAAKRGSMRAVHLCKCFLILEV